MAYRLLNKFQNLFDGKQYRHRSSTAGDSVAIELYEDLLVLGRSSKYVDAVTVPTSVVNSGNIRKGIAARRGDGAFGELVGTAAVKEQGYSVLRGPIATIEIGIEVKILAKAMIKQIDRVINDLQTQVTQFKKGGDRPISIGIVGINFAERTTSYEGERSNPTDGKRHKHPIQEAGEAERRLVALAKPAFDEFLILRYQATNEPPFDFKWVDRRDTEESYGALLIRTSRSYQDRF